METVKSYFSVKIAQNNYKTSKITDSLTAPSADLPSSVIGFAIPEDEEEQEDDDGE